MNDIFRFSSLIFLSILFAQCNSSNKDKQNRITNKSVEPQSKIKAKKEEAGKQYYLKVLDKFNKEQYKDLDILIFKFKDSYKHSVYLDSILQLEQRVKRFRDRISNVKDSLYQINSFAYFNFLHLPRFDSINYDRFNLYDINFKYEFSALDKKIFNSNFDISWYISQQYQNKTLCVAVAHFNDCENYIYLYSVDSTFNIIDKKLLYTNGCFASPNSNFRYKTLILNETNYLSVTTFNPDSSFNVISRNYYSLKDTIDDTTITEIGREYNTTYSVDSKGRFLKLSEKNFEKAYVKELYNNM